MGKLYDDRGNRMSPSYSTKNGVRYRFYVSSALLRGRKADVGSVGRVPAAEIESTVLAALKPQQQQGQSDSAPASIEDVERVVIARDHLLITTAGVADGDGTNREFRIPWSTKAKDAVQPRWKTMAYRKSRPTRAWSSPSFARMLGWIVSAAERMGRSNSSPRRTAFIPRSFARHSGSHFFRRKLRRRCWKVGSRPG